MTIMSKNRYKIIRVSVESVVALALTLLFLNWGGIFTRALGWLPKFEFWPALLSLNAGIVVLWLTLTVLFGRVYCSSFCPLGVLQDGIYRLRISGKKARRYKQKYTPARNWLRYGVLALFVALIAFGYGAFANLIEPYSIFGRMVSSTTGISLSLAIVSAVTLGVLVLLVLWKGRIWCNTLCPVGATLSLFSRYAMLHPVIDTDKCTSCGLCGKGCRASCIDTANHTVDTSRCVVCFDCLENCHSGAISFSWSLPRRSSSPQLVRECSGNCTQHSGTTEEKPADSGRRQFIATGALALGTALTAKAQFGAQGGIAELENKVVPDRKVPVVPAGSGGLRLFRSRCLGCQLCVEACRNNVLRPAITLDGFMQPVMNFEDGFCRPECTDCSSVCPAGAIKKITPEEKSSISIGHAVYVPQNCVVFTDGVKCGNCARHCPSGAISMVHYNPDDPSSLKFPSINTERCIGCGRCEYVCPSRPLSAIYVEGNEVHRNI